MDAAWVVVALGVACLGFLDVAWLVYSHVALHVTWITFLNVTWFTFLDVALVYSHVALHVDCLGFLDVAWSGNLVVTWLCAFVLGVVRYLVLRFLLGLLDQARRKEREVWRTSLEWKKFALFGLTSLKQNVGNFDKVARSVDFDATKLSTKWFGGECVGV